MAAACKRVRATPAPASVEAKSQPGGISDIEARRREEAVRRAIPQATADGAPQVSDAGATSPAWRARRFLIANENGARETLLLYVAQQGPWTFKLRYRAPASDDESVRRASERAELMWRGALADARR